MVTRKPRVELTRCSGTMTESQYLAWIRSALRSKWLRWQPRNDTIKAARRPYNGPNKLQKWEVMCAICLGWFLSKQIEVDHYPEDAGSILSVNDIGPFVGRLYCETTNLRAVCKPCHAVYTLSQASGISMEEARLEKRVNEQMKDKDILAFLAKHGYHGILVSNASKRKALVRTILQGERIE